MNPDPRHEIGDRPTDRLEDHVADADAAPVQAEVCGDNRVEMDRWRLAA